MFNKTYITAPSRLHVDHHSDVEVTVKRAPTDESVRLLSEMEEAARNKVIATIPLGNTDLDLKLLVEEDLMLRELKFTLLLKVNSKPHQCRLRGIEDFRFKTKDEKIAALRTSVAEAIAVIFLTELAMKPGAQHSLQKLLGEQ